MFSIHALSRVALITVVASSALFAQEPERAIVFGDNFTPSQSPLWNNHAGLWAAHADQYYAQVPNDNPLTYSGLPFVLTDYTLTVKTVIGDGGIWLRSDRNSPYGDYILLVLGGDNYGSGARGGSAGTSIYFATAQESGINKVDNVFTPGETYTVTVTARGDTFSVFINGATTPVAVFVDNALPFGQVGLYDNQPNTIHGTGFGTPTTFSNFSLSGFTVPPAVSVVSPDSGSAGSKVKIRGTNLQLASAVSFNGTPAKFFQKYPSSEIVAIVPDGATTGPIKVTTPIGTATSAVDFTVTEP